ncbi:MAG: ABC transporter permease [Bacteroidetes bacterium]|nr:ABC transporter permease [Bacteroidota bacterium]MDA0874536.1 ABC transporter permease [Bacteroidota bacterium]
MKALWLSIRRSPVALTAFIVLLGLVGVALLAPVLAPMDPGAIDIRARLSPPGEGGHILGTDNVGRDVLSRIIHGARISLFVGVATVLIGGIFGSVLGIVAGYFRGWVETVIMRLVDIQLAFPSILLAVAIMALVGPSMMNVVVVLSIATWAPFCRVARGQTLSVCNQEYITAAVSLGLSDTRILWRHVLPNIINPLIVVASFALATNIINEASLSFLGVGVPPSTPTWGGMLGEGRNYLRIAWWVATLPGIALMLSVYSVNMLGDWLRDHYDPRLTDS